MAQSLPKLSNSSHKSGTYKNACIRQAKDQLYKARNRTGDVKFIVETQEIWAHRCVLAALSPKFDAQFYGSMSENGDIQIADVTAAAFNEFLQFFYTDEITLTVGNIDDVFNLAKQSLVENLVNQCTDFLLDTVELDNVCTYLQLAIFHIFKELEEKCVKIISKNSQALFESPEFLNCNREVLIYILSLETLRCKEIDVFEASMKWARAECSQNGDDVTKAENLRTALDAAFFKIRFRSMTHQEFAAIHQVHRDLFTTDEAFEIFHVIGDAKDSKSNLFNKKPRKSKSDSFSGVKLTDEIKHTDVCFETMPCLQTPILSVCYTDSDDSDDSAVNYDDNDSDTGDAVLDNDNDDDDSDTDDAVLDNDSDDNDSDTGDAVHDNDSDDDDSDTDDAIVDNDSDEDDSDTDDAVLDNDSDDDDNDTDFDDDDGDYSDDYDDDDY